MNKKTSKPTKYATSNQFNSLSDQVQKLSEEFKHQFKEVDKRFELVDKRFAQVDKRFELVDKRFDQVDQRFSLADAKMNKMVNEIVNLKMDMKDMKLYMHENMVTKNEFRDLINRMDGFLGLHKATDMEQRTQAFQIKELTEVSHQHEERLNSLESNRAQ